ncbi:MAG: hypothetical protein ACXAEX_09845 [Promethearchaeota archaeon]
MNYTKLGSAIHIDNKPMHHILSSVECKLDLKEIDNKFTLGLIYITD